ncbi:hypothetical protein L3D22_10945 [Lysobacter soli]|uniref:hypothetical protein n=1 Tax=Lysobacter soli TaxID=453783 RepID=UPI0020A22745|nr:hypothetical protein [Lysobacter soli]UTA52904.1 hypothetical protein L3D22_10945 [Lysobacter soli]
MTKSESIESALVGCFYHRFAVGTGFDFHFDDFVLSSQELCSPDEFTIATVVAANPPAGTANADLIAKSAVIAACLGVPIVSAELLSDSSLSLTFDNGVVARLPTDTPVVDWHWAITETGTDPYLGCRIACYAPGDVQGDWAPPRPTCR